MKKNDPIVEEVRAARDRHAAKFGYDLKVIFRDLQAKQKASGRKCEQFHARLATAAAPVRAKQ